MRYPFHGRTGAASAFMLTIALLLTLTAPAQADDEESRKRLVRIGKGKFNYPEPTGRVYRLSELVEMLNESSVWAKGRNLALSNARLDKMRADWAFFPDITLRMLPTLAPKDPNLDDFSENLKQYGRGEVGVVVGLTSRAVFPLYTFGKIDAASRLAKLGIDAAKLQTTYERLELEATLKEAYVGAQLARHLKVMLKEIIGGLNEEIERQDEAREFGDGDIDVVALRKLKIQVAGIEEKRLQADEGDAYATGAIARGFNLDRHNFDVERFDTTLPENDLPSLERVTELARHNNPGVKLLDALVHKQRLKKEEALANLYPDVFFAVDGSFGLSNLDEPVLEQESNVYNYTRVAMTFGVQLSYQPADQWLKFKKAQNSFAKSKTEAELLLSGALVELEKQYHKTNRSLLRIRIIERKLKAAERWKNQVAIAYSSGGATQADFMKPLKDWLQYRADLAQALHKYRVNMIHLSKQVGVTDLHRAAATE